MLRQESSSLAWKPSWGFRLTWNQARMNEASCRPPTAEWLVLMAWIRSSTGPRRLLDLCNVNNAISSVQYNAAYSVQFNLIICTAYSPIHNQTVPWPVTVISAIIVQTMIDMWYYYYKSTVKHRAVVYQMVVKIKSSSQQSSQSLCILWGECSCALRAQPSTAEKAVKSDTYIVLLRLKEIMFFETYWQNIEGYLAL